MNSSNDHGKKKSGLLKYFIYMAVVLIATAISLTISLWGDNFNSVIKTMGQADWRYVLLTFGVVALTYAIEGLIIFIFCRLYTRKYKYHQGLACSLVGQFYSDVTPGASGGQVMQVYTLKSQGILVSNAASIMVMWFILYQTALILFGVISLGFEWQTVFSMNPSIPLFGTMWNPPMWPLIVIGFGLNLSVILLLFVMSYSRHFHNFILHYVIGFLGKIHILKKPDQTRESLRVQVENFKIELRRLQSNVPVLILLVFLFMVMLLLRFSIPYFCGLAMHAWGEENVFVFASLDDGPSMVRASFLTAFHQMVTGLFPLPGSAGVSELFYNMMFQSFFGESGPNYTITSATQILWRSATFHIVLVITGIVSAFYHSRGGASVTYASRKTFVTLQLETYDERKKSADTMYETSQFSRKELQRRFSAGSQKPKGKDITIPYDDEPEELESRPFGETRLKIADTQAQHSYSEALTHDKTEKKKKEKPKTKPKKKQKEASSDGWETWEI